MSGVADTVIMIVNALIVIVVILCVWLIARLDIWAVRTRHPWLSAKGATWYALAGIALTVAYILFINLARPTIIQAIAGFCGYLAIAYLGHYISSRWRLGG